MQNYIDDGNKIGLLEWSLKTDQCQYSKNKILEGSLKQVFIQIVVRVNKKGALQNLENYEVHENVPEVWDTS